MDRSNDNQLGLLLKDFDVEMVEEANLFGLTLNEGETYGTYCE